MVTILSIFTSSSYREIRLPNLVNTDFEFILYKKVWNLSDDIEIKMENINGMWQFSKNNHYTIMKDKEKYEEKSITNQDLLILYTENGESFTIIVKNVKYSISVFDKFDISNISELSIGKNNDNDICFDYEGLVSRNHARIYRDTANQWILEVTGVNGMYVNSSLVKDSVVLRFGDYISFTDLHMMFLGNCLAVDRANANIEVNEKKLTPIEIKFERKKKDENEIEEENKFLKDGMKLLRRSPRNIEKIYTDTIEIEEPPELQRHKKQSIFMTIGPSFTMMLPMVLGSLLMVYSSKMSGGSSSLMMYSGLVMAISSALVAVIWGIINVVQQKKDEKEEKLHRFDAYSNYLIKRTDMVKDRYANNIKSMNEMYQSADVCADYDENTSVLWNRNFRHNDYMYYRLGVGNLPFQVNVNVPKERFRLYEDVLTEKPRFIKENYQMLYDVPVGIDLLKRRLVGLIGGDEKKGAVDVVKALMTQIAASNSYTDIKIVFVYDGRDSANLDKWDFVRWFPHVWSEDKKMRFIASNKQEAGDVFYSMAQVFRQREEEMKIQQSNQENLIQKPYFIMFLMNPEMIEGELIEKYIFDVNTNYGLTTIIATDSYTSLPNACDYIIENDNNFKGMYDVRDGQEDRIQISFDSISDSRIESFAKRLSNIYVRETESGGDIPTSITFFEMYGATKLQDLNVLDRWRKNRTYDNIKGMTGVKAGGAPSYLDVHEKYHGPHGLVAGTTGSGKSETLQTYMLSLAVNYSPDDIGFFIIDYKGGGMANLFDGLPHMIGQISNLSGNQVHRAMVSIKSENRRRQRVFSENGVNNINLYTKLYKNNEVSLPVPHLFIIIDEFAELKREEPDFMKELVSVAQVGRSLGVHLILATQKPSGTVDDNIWSNSKFRLCLRVQDRQDSMDMLHKPEAAYITQAGRAYLQVGNDEVFELFQSGFSGAIYTDDDDDGKVDIANMISLTGHVDMTGSYAKAAMKQKATIAWLATIEKYLLDTLAKNAISIEECLESKIKMQVIVDELYHRFENDAIDYPVSQYNSDRLVDYIQLYASVRTESDPIPHMVKRSEQNNIKLPQAKDKTQLDAVKEYLAKVAKANGYTHELQLWMPVLPTAIYLNDFSEYTEACYQDGQWPKHTGDWNIDVIYGLYDDPQNQAQMPIHINFTEGGSHAIFGMVGSGKSTSMQTIVYGLVTKYSPDYINIYAIDFSSKSMIAFEHAPHCGGVMFEGDYDKIAKCFNMIQSILDERKKLFRGGNYSQYVQVHGMTVPMILLVIDNFSAFNEKTQEAYMDFIVTLSKEGVTHGIYLLISGLAIGMQDIPSRVVENVKTSLTTEMVDRFAYTDILHVNAVEVTPETNVKGRGLAYCGDRILEYQTALACKAEDDYKRIEAINALCDDMSANWTGRKARPVPEIPEKPIWSEFSQLEDFQMAVANPRWLPMGYNSENASILSVDLMRVYCYLITGLAKSGKKNTMRILINSAVAKNADVYVFDGENRELRAFEGAEGLNYINTEEGVFEAFSGITPEFKRRKEIRDELVERDVDEEELFEAISKEKPIFFFIPNLVSFTNMVYKSDMNMSGFLENVIAKGENLNIYFIASITISDLSEVSYQDMIVSFLKFKTGVHFGGAIDGNSVLNFNSIPYKEQEKLLKPGIGYVSYLADENVEQVIVPSARR